MPTPAPEPLTAGQYERIFHAALADGDTRGVEAALIGLALRDPHRAQILLDLTRVALQVASDPTLRPALDAALANSPGQDASLADKVRGGGQRAVDIAAELAAGLLQIAKLAMPDSYYQTDSRCQFARSLLDGTTERSPDDVPPLNDFGQDILRRCRWARDHNDGRPAGAWSTGEQLAVAVVLHDIEHLTAMGYTLDEATASVAGRMDNPPSDINAWVDAIRTELGDGR